MGFVKRLKAAYDICAGSEQLTQTERDYTHFYICLLYTSPSPRDRTRYRMPSSA